MTIKKSIILDISHDSDPVMITLSIKLPNCPCVLLSLDLFDDLLKHRANIPITKLIIDSEEKPTKIVR